MTITAKYPYMDEKKQTLYIKYRVEPGFNGSSKSFYYEHTDENGNTIKNLDGCKKVLYRLPQLLYGIKNNLPIYLVEGEKDVDNLLRQTIIASTTTNSLEWEPEYTAILKDADVIILYDMDKTGFKRRELLCEQLYGNVKRLRVVELPGLKYTENHGADVSDWLAKGNTIDHLKGLVNATADYVPESARNETQQTKIKTICIQEFLSLDLAPQEMILNPFLTRQGLVMLYAKRGVGKTHIALGIAYAVASGGSFLRWNAPEPRNVLYIDGEMPAVALQERLRKIAAHTQKKATDDSLKIITPDLQPEIMPDLATKDGQAMIEQCIHDRDLIIIDNISSLFRSTSENEAESWQPVQEWALALRKRGKSVLFVHHAGKSGQQRGTSKREDQLDTVIILKHPDEYDAQEGACFEIHYEKTRHFFGEDATAFKVRLTEDANNNWNWHISHLDIEEEITEVAQFVNDGLTIAQITEKTNLTKSKVETRIKKARRNGLIQK